MKKKYLVTLFAAFTAACTLGFTACGDGGESGGHQHNYVYRDNGDGTHLKYCINDGCDNSRGQEELCADKTGDGLCDDCGYKLETGKPNEGEQEGGDDKTENEKPDDKEQGGSESGQGTEIFEYTLSADGNSYTVKAGADAATVTEIVIPSTYNGLPVTTVGSFKNCSKLASITIPDSVTSVGSFTGTAYYENENNWENDVLYIGKHLIDAKKDISGSYEIKPGTLTVSSAAFYDCVELTGLSIPDSVISIGSAAFYNCIKMTGVTIGNGVTTIGYSAFQSCSELTSVILPDSVTTLGYAAFFMCSKLTSIIIPVGVTEMGIWMFKDCPELEKVYYRGTADDWEKITGSGVPTNKTKYYYSETRPAEDGNYWHYVDGEVAEW